MARTKGSLNKKTIIQREHADMAVKMLKRYFEKDVLNLWRKRKKSNNKSF